MICRFCADIFFKSGVSSSYVSLFSGCSRSSEFIGLMIDFDTLYDSITVMIRAITRTMSIGYMSPSKITIIDCCVVDTLKILPSSKRTA